MTSTPRDLVFTSCTCCHEKIKSRLLAEVAEVSRIWYKNCIFQLQFVPYSLTSQLIKYAQKDACNTRNIQTCFMEHSAIASCDEPPLLSSTSDLSNQRPQYQR